MVAAQFGFMAQCADHSDDIETFLAGYAVGEGIIAVPQGLIFQCQRIIPSSRTQDFPEVEIHTRG
jgi:hypothetical protein